MSLSRIKANDYLRTACARLQNRIINALADDDEVFDYKDKGGGCGTSTVDFHRPNPSLNVVGYDGEEWNVCNVEVDWNDDGPQLRVKIARGEYKVDYSDCYDFEPSELEKVAQYIDDAINGIIEYHNAKEADKILFAEFCKENGLNPNDYE